MKNLTLLLLLTLCMYNAGCHSGTDILQFGDGRLIEPQDLAAYNSGSLSTVWYRGSDEDFHYFAHFVKTSTMYKVNRTDLEVADESVFPLEKNVYVIFTSVDGEFSAGTPDLQISQDDTATDQVEVLNP